MLHISGGPYTYTLLKVADRFDGITYSSLTYSIFAIASNSTPQTEVSAQIFAQNFREHAVSE